VLGSGGGLFAGLGRRAGEELERFVDENDGQRELDNGEPLGGIQRANLKDDVEDVHVENHEVEGHGKADRQKKVNVLPGRHADHRLVLRHAVQSVEHLDDDQDGKGHRHGLRVAEDGFAIDALEHGVVTLVAVEMVGQLVVGQLGAGIGDHVPPGGSADRRRAHVQPDDHVTEKEPGGDERFFRGTWLLLHDVQIGRIETQSGGGKAVGDQVDPKQLNGDQRLGEAQSRRQEDAYDFADVGGNQVTDELLHVVVDRATFLNGGDDGREVIVG